MSPQINSTELSLITTLQDIISPPQSILNFLTWPSAFHKLLLCFARNSIDLGVCQSPPILKSPNSQVCLETFPRQTEAKIYIQKKNFFLQYSLHIVSDVSDLHHTVSLEWLRFGNQLMLLGEVTLRDFAWGHISRISKLTLWGCILLSKFHIPQSWSFSHWNSANLGGKWFFSFQLTKITPECDDGINFESLGTSIFCSSISMLYIT